MALRFQYRFVAVAISFLLMMASAYAQPVSDFTSSAESWGTIGKCPSESSPGATWSATGGNPGGMIYETDEATGTVYWNGSGSEWKADLTSYYGCNFSYDSKTDNVCCSFSAQYQILFIRGDDHALSYVTAYSPSLVWTTNVIPLTESGWVYEGLFNSDANCPDHVGTAATAADMLSFLGDMKRIRIRTEYAGLVYETNFLDNVKIDCTPIGLAAEYASFNVYDIGNGRAQLDWVTETETENKYFQVEKSEDGMFFDSIGVVYSDGTSNSTQNYGFLDPNFLKSTYYRLRTLNFNNVVQFSNVVFLERLGPETSTLRIDPNPASTGATLLIGEPGNVLSWQILDLSGNVIAGAPIGVYNGWFSTTIECNDWSSGVYIIKIATDHGFVTSKFQVVH